MSTKQGGTVLDVFSGTGTAIRVCRRIQRDCTSIELDPFYCQKIAEEHGLEVRCEADLAGDQRAWNS